MTRKVADAGLYFLGLRKLDILIARETLAKVFPFRERYVSEMEKFQPDKFNILLTFHVSYCSFVLVFRLRGSISCVPFPKGAIYFYSLKKVRRALYILDCRPGTIV
jgi:hypothetical protein